VGNRFGWIIAAVLGLAVGTEARAQAERWDKDVGKPAPRLIAAGWVGTPVSLDALRKSDTNPREGTGGATVAKKSEVSGGNTVVLAFWSADIPC